MRTSCDQMDSAKWKVHALAALPTGSHGRAFGWVREDILKFFFKKKEKPVTLFSKHFNEYGNQQPRIRAYTQMYMCL